MSNHVFISYSRKDSDVMMKLRNHLEAVGVDVWTDERIRIGEDWEKSIDHAIKDSEYVIVILSPNSTQSEWIQNEVEISQKYHKSILPLLVSGEKSSALPPTLNQSIMIIDARQDFEQAVEKLSATLLSTENGK